MDHKTSNGLWLLPTRNRPHNLRRFFDNCTLVGLSTMGLVVVNSDDYAANLEEYRKVRLPKGWGFYLVTASCLNEALKAVEADGVLDELAWVGLLGDDNVPVSPDWDTILIGALTGWNVVSCNDGWQAPRRMTGATLFSGAWLRAVGGLPLDGARHLFLDDRWETVGRATDSWHVRMDVLVRHIHPMHPEDNLALDDGYARAYEKSNWDNDERAFKCWKEQELDGCVERVNALKAEHSVTKHEVDFTGISIMVASPVASGRVEVEYVSSLYQTLLTLHERKVPYTWVIEMGNADIVAARANLFHSFLNSPYTHLLLIDDDMGWESSTLGRLMLANKDFVAVAGRRKRDQISFALNPIPTEEGFAKLDVDLSLGVCEVAEVGMAFALISRNCIESMVKAYPDLVYTSGTGEKQHSLCLPLITPDGVYKAEDYAFCYRWRAIGGKVFVCPDIPLKHIGKKTYAGAWTDVWQHRSEVMGEGENGSAI